MPLQLSASLVKRSTPADMVGGHFSESEIPSIALSAADIALRSDSSSPAPRTKECSSMDPIETEPRRCHGWEQASVHA